jgi:hypothetical protein
MYGYTVQELSVSNTASRMGLPNTPVSQAHLDNLKRLDSFLKGIPFQFSINSAYRAPDVNSAVGGSPSSQHMNALSVDLNPIGISNEDLATWFWAHRSEYPELDQVIWYTDTNHIHIGICPDGASNCVSGGPRGHFYKAQKEGSNYSRWVPDNAGMGAVLDMYRQTRPNRMKYLVYGLLGLGAVGSIWLVLRIRNRNS